MEQGEETVQQHVVRYRSGVIVLPDAGALDHITLDLLGRGLSVIPLLLVSHFGGKLGFEVVGDILLGLLGLLLFLQAGQDVISVFALGLCLLLFL